MNVKIIDENRFGEREIHAGKVVNFMVDGTAIVVFTEGPNKTMIKRCSIDRLRAILDEEETD